MTSTVDPATLTPPIQPLSQRLFDFLLWGGIIVMLIASFGPAEMTKFPLLFSNSENMRQFGSGFLHPDFSGWQDLVGKMWLTIQMALWGTTLAIVFAIPMGLLGARNVAPPFVQLPIRRLMDLIRSVPDLVIGTAFLVAVGLGPFAGVLALSLNTGGVLAKLFAEAVESIDSGPVEGVRATGAVPLQEVIWGVIPQVAPLPVRIEQPQRHGAGPDRRRRHRPDPVRQHEQLQLLAHRRHLDRHRRRGDPDRPSEPDDPLPVALGAELSRNRVQPEV